MTLNKSPLLLAVLSAFLLASAAPAQNLLNNGSYEDPLGFDFSDTSNWNGFFGGPDGVFLEAFNDTGAVAFDGSQALELTIAAGALDDGTPVNGTSSFTGHVQTVGGIISGTDYTYSTYARNNDSGLTGTVEFRIEWFDSSGAEVSRDQIELQSALTDSYQLFELTQTAPAGAVSANVVTAVASFNQDVAHDHSVLFDATSLTVVPEPGALALVSFGMLAMLGIRRRR